MTTLTEALRQALDRLDAALRDVEPFIMTIAVDDMAAAKREAAALRAALATPAAPSVPAWQPIETAPKGRILLVGYYNRAGKWRTVRGRYYEAETLESEVSDDGWAPEGWYEEVDNAEEINFTDEPPTHWMPIPAAPSTATGATQADPLRAAARLVAEATPEQLPMALDALRDHMGAAQEPARAEPQPPALDWPAMLLLLNEYAMHVHDASEHQAESRADISKTAALKSLERIRMALAAHNSRWQALVHELIWRATPAAQDLARVALPADLIEYMRKHLQRERHGLDGFTVLGNETARAEKYDRWISALLAAGIPGTDGGADHG